MKPKMRPFLAFAVVAAVAVAILGVSGAVASDSGADGKVQSMAPLHGSRPSGAGGAATSSANLYYHGGASGVGAEIAPRVYVVYWGSG